MLIRKLFVFLFQIAKLCIIPVLCVLEILFDKVRYSRDTKLSIVLVLVGVAVCTVTDVSVNSQGLLAAVVAVWSTAIQQHVSILWILKPILLLAIFLHIACFQVGAPQFTRFCIACYQCSSFQFELPMTLDV
jgi:hypothetical protein